jgi:hypothetical protein
MHWTWLLHQQARQGHVRFEQWLLWDKLALLDQGFLLGDRLVAEAKTRRERQDIAAMALPA